MVKIVSFRTAFILVAIFITLVVTANITIGVTEDIVGTALSSCEAQCEARGQPPENLPQSDVTFCKGICQEATTQATPAIVNRLSFLKPFANFSTNQILIWVVLLSGIGLVLDKRNKIL